MSRALFLLALLTACGGAEPSATTEEHGHDEASGVVELGEAAREAARLRIEPARTGSLSRELSSPGRIALDPLREAQLSAWMGGQVDDIAVRPGDDVRRGQRLASIRSPELGEAVAAYRGAVARDEAADARLERVQRLQQAGVASEAQLHEAEADHAETVSQLEAAEERLRILGVPRDAVDPHAGEHYPSRVPLTSPIDGTLLTAEATVGTRVEPGQALFRIGDLSTVWLLIDVFERDLSALREGQTVRFTVPAWPGRTFSGTVDQVGDWVEPSSRTVEVRVVVDNADEALKPNMFASVLLDRSDGTGERGIVLPAEALSDDDGQPIVYREVSEGHYEPVVVGIGARTAREVLVTSGLSEGDRVVIEGAFAVHSQANRSELGGGHAH